MAIQVYSPKFTNYTPNKLQFPQKFTTFFFVPRNPKSTLRWLLHFHWARNWQLESIWKILFQCCYTCVLESWATVWERVGIKILKFQKKLINVVGRSGFESRIEQKQTIWEAHWKESSYLETAVFWYFIFL